MTHISNYNMHPAQLERYVYDISWSLPTGQKLLLLVAATLVLHHSTTAYGAASSGSISMARPGCPDKCGNISIPYPFGTGKGCFQEPFNVTCNGTGAYLGSNGLRVLDISLALGEVRVQNPHITSRCNFSNGSNSTSGLDVLTLDPFHTVSNMKNKLTSIGCGGLAMLVGQAKGKNQLEYLTADSCISSCMDVSSIGNGTECSGMGCCQAPVSGNINAFLAQSIPVSAIYNSTIQSFSPCTYSFVAEDDWFKFDRSYINSTNFGRKYTDGVPLVLDWVVGNGSCSETSKMGSQYACQAMNSECIDVSNGPGYRCNCSQGYEGNPYLQGGCKDINECEPPNQSLYPCKGNCRNTVGSYTCSCSSGFRSDDPKSIPCVQADPNKALKVALGTSAGVVFLMVCMFALRAEHQKRKLAKEKERFFDQNGGQILYHQIISKQVDSLMIFTQEDLKKATNDFDESREVGRGGHGTVYKGVLKDGRVIAVKRSKIMNVAETNEFVQEIIILSQTNHRNVVRLLGCCLEVEVPILVYEFIPNGTLFEFIHRNRGTPPPSLDTRLRGTLGYLDPEYLQERQLTEKSDVYSFGIVLLELITGKTAIYHDGPKEGKSLASSFLLAMKEESLDGILDASILSAGMETLLREVAELARMCLSTRGEERPSMIQVADKLKALRSTWREKLLLTDGETECLVSAPAALAFHDPLSSIMFSTGPRMSGIGIVDCYTMPRVCVVLVRCLELPVYCPYLT
ncbi:hypothetical protein VPH35_069066 [Triticum aestivum]